MEVLAIYKSGTQTCTSDTAKVLKLVNGGASRAVEVKQAIIPQIPPTLPKPD